MISRRRLWIGRGAALLACTMLMYPLPASGATAKTLAEWNQGYASGADWFGKDFVYDITDVDACWALLQKPITVLDAGEKEDIYLLTEPDGERVNSDKLGGSVVGKTAAVHVLGKDEDGWTLIEGIDTYDRLLRGYVKTSLLKTVTPEKSLGVIVDKLVQRLYVFKDGELFSSCAVSTGLPTGEHPYHETASGEYLAASRVGSFVSENGLICEHAIRYNHGDLIHQVPFQVLDDGTKLRAEYESRLGTKASNGCIRIPRYRNDEGLNMDWFWNHLLKNTKVIIWDDDGRRYPYYDDTLELYYLASGGTRYHATANCTGIKKKYRPLASFRYGELDTEQFAGLEPCEYCVPAKRTAWIDAFNLSRGMTTTSEAKQEQPAHPPHLSQNAPAEVYIP